MLSFDPALYIENFLYTYTEHSRGVLVVNLLCHSKTDVRFMQDGRKAVWSIPYVSVASFFPSLKQNVIAYRSSKLSDCIFEIHRLWQSGFSRAYSNSCCSFSFEAEIIKIGQSSHKMDSNRIVNFQEPTIILNACTKKSMETYCVHYIYIYTVVETGIGYLIKLLIIFL